MVIVADFQFVSLPSKVELPTRPEVRAAWAGVTGNKKLPTNNKSAGRNRRVKRRFFIVLVYPQPSVWYLTRQ